MSYVVSIVRDKPIERDEVSALAGGASGFEFDEVDTTCVLHWTDAETSKRESFVLSDGILDITSPSDSALLIAQELARKLGARVTGEEGEDLSDVSVPSNATSAAGCGPFAGTAILIAVLLALYWLII